MLAVDGTMPELHSDSTWQISSVVSSLVSLHFSQNNVKLFGV